MERRESPPIKLVNRIGTSIDKVFSYLDSRELGEGCEGNAVQHAFLRFRFVLNARPFIQEQLHGLLVRFSASPEQRGVTTAVPHVQSFWGDPFDELLYDREHAALHHRVDHVRSVLVYVREIGARLDELERDALHAVVAGYLQDRRCARLRSLVGRRFVPQQRLNYGKQAALHGHHQREFAVVPGLTRVCLPLQKHLHLRIDGKEQMIKLDLLEKYIFMYCKLDSTVCG